MIDIIKTKLRTCDKVYTNSCGLNASENDIECIPVTVISIEFLLVYKNKYYLQVYLDNCAYKVVDKQMLADYLGDNPFAIDKD